MTLAPLAWASVATRKRVADGSALAKAIDYSLKRWTALIRYADSGDLPIDNNPVENAIRPIAIGKNYPRSTIRQGPPPRAATCVADRVLEFA